MLHIILLILKIIGIILLCILGIVLLVIITVLFVPVRYKIDFSIYEYGSIKCRVSWLLHIISVNVGYGKQKNGQMGLYKNIKLFGINLLGIRKKSHDKKNDDTTEKHDKISIYDSKNDIVDEKNTYENKNTENSYNFETASDDEIVKNPVTTVKESDEADSYDNGGESIRNFADTEPEYDEETKRKKDNIFKKISSKIRKILFKIKSVCGKIKKMSAKARSVKEFVELDETKEAVRFIKGQLGILIEHVRPRIVRGHIKFGTGDPAYTAELLGIYYLISKGRYKKMYMEPDFDNAVLDGEVHIKGRIVVFSLVVMAIKIYKNENLKTTISNGKNLKEEL